MAELIDKGALYNAMTEEYKKHYAGTGKGYDFTIAMQMVQKQPTTTEAEIRASAHQEFYDKVLNFEDYIEPVMELDGIQLYSGRDITYMVRKIVEQLKECE